MMAFFSSVAFGMICLDGCYLSEKCVAEDGKTQVKVSFEHECLQECESRPKSFDVGKAIGCQDSSTRYLML
jgi:hypothetical protein